MPKLPPEKEAMVNLGLRVPPVYKTIVEKLEELHASAGKGKGDITRELFLKGIVAYAETSDLLTTQEARKLEGYTRPWKEAQEKEKEESAASTFDVTEVTEHNTRRPKQRA